MADHEEAFNAENYTGDDGAAAGEVDMDDVRQLEKGLPTVIIC